jgi:hypothetical protein
MADREGNMTSHHDRALAAAEQACKAWDHPMPVAVLEKVIEAYMREIEPKMEVERLRAALREILDPISGMRERMNVADGESLNGPMAIGLSNNPNYLKEIARAAISTKEQANG